ncbi:MAG TPA: PEGA domain-containing protein [Polyangia bacterium]|nr:PEGA domain-containing protein [Polyangia bacterium]
MAGSAYAQTPIAVLGIEPQDAPEALARELTQALRQRAAGAQGFSTVAGKDLVEIKLVFGCVDEAPSCMAHAGRSLGAQKLLFGTLRKVPGGFKVSLKWLDVPKANLENALTEPVPAESATSAGIRGLAVRWFATLSGIKVGGALQVTSNVNGAKIYIDDHLAGAATSEKPIAVSQLQPGIHEVRAEKPGYRPFSQRIRVAPGEVTQVSARLEEEPAAAPPPQTAAIPTGTEHPPDNGEQPGRGWRIGFWTSAGVFVGMAVGVIALGVKVQDLQDQKKQRLGAPDLDPQARASINQCAAGSGTCEDVCPFAGTDARLKSICDDASLDSKLVNVFVAVGVTAVGLAGLSYYMGYMEPGNTSNKASAAPASSSRLHVGPRVYGTGSGVGVVAEFEF